MEPTEPKEEDRTEPTLAQGPEEDQGRIGYGKKMGVYTPLGLALIIIAALVAIGIYNQRGNDIPANNIRLGAEAPPIEQASINNTGDVTLASHDGKVVILNFWASWCDPCRDEMPMMQDVVNANPDSLAIIGVDMKNDTEYAAQRFLETTAINYQVVRDDSAGTTPVGPIAEAYGVGTNYPTTIVLSPSGQVAAFHIGPVTEKQLNDLIEKARNYDA